MLKPIFLFSALLLAPLAAVTKRLLSKAYQDANQFKN